MAVVDEHGDDQGIIMREMNRLGICFQEHDWLARGQRRISQDHRIVGLTGLVDVDGAFPLGRPFERASAKNGIHFPVVDEGATRWTLSLLSLGTYLLHLNI